MPYRSLNVKFLNTEKSTFLYPESRNMFRPIVPKVPALGGVMTELPAARHPPSASVLGSGALLAQFEINAAEFAAVVEMLDTPVVVVQEAPLVSTPPPARTANPEQKGIEFWVPLKSDGLPKKSQRSAPSPVPLKPFWKLGVV